MRLTPRSAFALLLLLGLAAPAAAQPSPETVVGAWLREWHVAVRDVDRIEMEETLRRRVEGPRGTVILETRGTVRFDPGRPGLRPERRLHSATVDGRPVDVNRVDELDRRLVRAFGRGSEETARPPFLPADVLARATPVGLDLDSVDGQPAWRVAFRLADLPPHPARGPRRPSPRTDRADAWFTRSAEAPRLLRIRIEGERPHGATFARAVQYGPVDGLDLPAATGTTIEVRQRRRLRVYATTIASDARYRRAAVVRR